MRKFFRIFAKFFEAAVLVLIVCTGAFLWRLHKAPIDIDEFIPKIVQFLARPERGLFFSIESAKLQWGKFSRPVELVAKNFKATFEDGSDVLSVSEMSMAFSIRALLVGRISPRSVTIYDPFLHLNIDEKGQVYSSLIGKQEDKEAEKEEDVEKSAKKFLPLDFFVDILEMEDDISKLSLQNARILIKDDFNRKTWDIPKANLTYRHTLLRRRIAGDLVLKTPERSLEFSLNALWGRNSSEMRLEVALKDLNIASLRISNQYPFLKNITVPVDLTGVMKINLRPLLKRKPDAWKEALKEAEFHLKAGKGRVDLPAPVLAYYDVSSLSLDARWYDKGDKFDITRFDLALQKQGSATGSLKISGLKKAVETGGWESIKAVFNTEANDVPLDDLHAYWPASIAPGVHHWVTTNITKGTAAKSVFELHFAGKKEAGLTNTFVKGSVDIKNAKVLYLDELPPVEDVDGLLLFSLSDIKGNLFKGHTFDVQINSGTIDFINLDEPVSHMVLDLNLSGGAKDVLSILDYPYLGFIGDAGLKPENASGNVEGTFFLKLPLGDAFISSSQIETAAKAKIVNASMKQVFADFNATDGTVSLDLKNRIVNLSGAAMFYGSPASFELFHSFNKTDDLRTKITVESALKNETRRYFDYGTKLLVPPAVDGLLDTKMTYTVNNRNEALLSFDIDLDNVNINWNKIGWKKTPETSGRGNFSLPFKDGVPQRADFFLTDADENRIDGTMSFNPEGKFDRLSVKIDAGRTDVDAVVSVQDSNSVNAVITGKTLDISGMIRNSGAQGANAKSPDANSDLQPAENSTESPDVFVSAKVDKIWLSKNGYANNTDIYVEKNGDEWREIRLSSLIKDVIPMDFSMFPAAKKGVYDFTLTSPDAGETLRSLDYISSVQGGEITVKGTYDSIENVSDGIVNISAFRIEHMPVFTQILSLSGIIDTVKGDGMLFDKSDISFQLNGETLTLKDGLVSGPSLGVTLSGKYYRDTGFLNLKGSLVPLYSINSFLGKIPFIGRIFSGEKGGGLIAPTYTVLGKLPSPKISVNAFSALAPGVVRSFIEYFTSSDADLSKKPVVAAASTPDPDSKKDVKVQELSSTSLENTAVLPAVKELKAPSLKKEKQNIKKRSEKELRETLEKNKPL